MTVAEDAMRAMQQQFTTALDSLTRQNVDLQVELAQSRQQAASEVAALRQEVGAPQRGSQTTRVDADTRLLRKLGELSGAQDAWRDWSAVFWGYAGAAVPRLQKLMVEAAKANATNLEEEDRAASAQLFQLYWMMLTICKGAALNNVFPRAEDETTFCGTTDVHPVLLTAGRHDRTNHSLGTRDSHLRTGQSQILGR